MTDNRQTQEAATIRQKSEFIKRVDDFASYMQKEYIDEGSERSLLISAGDRSIGDSQGGMAHILLGDKTLTTAGLVSMMQHDGFSDLFRMARIVSADYEDLDEVISGRRRRLRMLYGTAGMSALWTLCIIGFQIVGVAHWITTISNLLLMACAGFMLWREIRSLRRQIARMKATDRKEHEARMKHRMDTFFDELLRRVKMDDDDDE